MRFTPVLLTSQAKSGLSLAWILRGLPPMPCIYDGRLLHFAAAINKKLIVNGKKMKCAVKTERLQDIFPPCSDIF
jgi:hypothetical protein